MNMKLNIVVSVSFKFSNYFYLDIILIRAQINLFARINRLMLLTLTDLPFSFNFLS